MLVRPDAGIGQLVGNSGQFGCRPWSVSLAKLVNCCGESGQVAGVLHLCRVQVVALLPENSQLAGEPPQQYRQQGEGLHGWRTEGRHFVTS